MWRAGTGERRERGYAYLELIVAVMVLLVLAGAAFPLAHWDHKRRLEGRLRVNLETMRNAIDLYKKYSEEGLIVQKDVEQLGYPLTLEELVDGVEVGDPKSPESRTIRFLRRVPVDPITGLEEWGLRSYQDDWDSSSWGRENVYDIYSLSRKRAVCAIFRHTNRDDYHHTPTG